MRLEGGAFSILVAWDLKGRKQVVWPTSVFGHSFLWTPNPRLVSSLPHTQVSLCTWSLSIKLPVSSLTEFSLPFSSPSSFPQPILVLTLSPWTSSGYNPSWPLLPFIQQGGDSWETFDEETISGMQFCAKVTSTSRTSWHVWSPYFWCSSRLGPWSFRKVSGLAWTLCTSVLSTTF